MMPPSNGALNSVSFDGRTYSSAPGVPIPVPDFDAAVLQANGWITLPPQPFINSTTVTATSGVNTTYYDQGIINPATTSTAVVPVIQGEAVYPSGAPAIVSPGHIIGVLGHITNANAGTIPLAIGVEGKVDNTSTGTITTAVCNDSNLGSNSGAITTLFFNYADLGTNAGTIGFSAGLVIQVD